MVLVPNPPTGRAPRAAAEVTTATTASLSVSIDDAGYFPNVCQA